MRVPNLKSSMWLKAHCEAVMGVFKPVSACVHLDKLQTQMHAPTNW